MSHPQSPPALNIPHSTSTVQVRVIDTGTLLFLDPKLFWQPEIKGFDGLHSPIYCFLISNGDRHIIFDLGVRPDWENYAPKIVSLIKATTKVTPGSDVAGVLDSDKSGLNIRSFDIESVIWSHNHFDHIGDPSRFPATTTLVVGPGVREVSWPGWPKVSDASVRESDIEGRTVREISFDPSDDRTLDIGRFQAFDFFGDGSFYLLNAPGHAVGHLCALARTTADPPSFIFMGADACHHPGILRPTEYLPLPQTLKISPLAHVPVCPGTLFQSLTLKRTLSSPFFTVARSPLFPDYDAAMETIGKIQELDSSDNVFVIIAHDLSLRDQIPFFPQTINQWKSKNLRADTRWLFCADFESAVSETNHRGLK